MGAPKRVSRAEWKRERESASCRLRTEEAPETAMGAVAERAGEEAEAGGTRRRRAARAARGRRFPRAGASEAKPPGKNAE
jgi:hypothetical protein